MEEEGDLSQKTRAYLIRKGLECASEKSYAKAQDYFGAAIRRAKSVGLWDVEAEVFRFVALFREGKWDAAIQRATTLRERADLVYEVAQMEGRELSRDILVERLEQAIVVCMTKRGDGFVAVTSHFWNPAGRDSKEGLLKSIFKARQSATVDLKIDFDFCKVEVAPFTEFLRERLLAGGMKEDAAEVAVPTPRASESAAVTPSAVPQAAGGNGAGTSQEEAFRTFLDGIVNKTKVDVSDAWIDRLHQICRTTRSHDNLAKIAAILAFWGPVTARPFLHDLATNSVVRDPTVVFSRPAAAKLAEAVKMLDGM